MEASILVTVKIVCVLCKEMNVNGREVKVNEKIVLCICINLRDKCKWRTTDSFNTFKYLIKYPRVCVKSQNTFPTVCSFWLFC